MLRGSSSLRAPWRADLHVFGLFFTLEQSLSGVAMASSAGPFVLWHLSLTVLGSHSFLEVGDPCGFFERIAIRESKYGQAIRKPYRVVFLLLERLLAEVISLASAHLVVTLHSRL